MSQYKKNVGRKPPKPVAPRPVNPGDSLELTDKPRLAAYRVLQECAAGRTPEESLESHSRLLSPRDLGLATALVYETLRHQSFLDALIKARLSRGRAPAELQIILRLGLAQLIFFSRLGDHAVVMETVALAKIIAPGRQGLVNAVLRGLLRDREAGAIPWPPEAPATGDPQRDLAAKYSCPPWLLKKLWQDLGPEETEQLLAAMNSHTPPTLRLNPLKSDRATLAATLPDGRPTELSPWGLSIENFSGQPADWPGFAEGLFAVQDEASQLAGLLAGKLAGADVLDACAGLGGKGLHLAALNPTAAVTCLDKNPQKLKALEREARRLGCANIKTEPRDLLGDPPPPASFDLVLLDAPCSGLGVIRRRPDLKWNKTEDDVTRLADLQLRLLLSAAEAVRPNGRLIYGVCSFSREEGPENAQKFLERRPDFSPAPPRDWPEALRPLLSEAHNLTLWPHRHSTDGFFWALFIKNSPGADIKIKDR